EHRRKDRAAHRGDGWPRPRDRPPPRSRGCAHRAVGPSRRRARRAGGRDRRGGRGRRPLRSRCRPRPGGRLHRRRHPRRQRGRPGVGSPADLRRRADRARAARQPALPDHPDPRARAAHGPPRLRPHRLHVLALRQDRDGRQLALQRDEVRPARLRRRDARRTARHGRRRVDDLPGLHPRGRDVRRRERQAAVRRRHEDRRAGRRRDAGRDREQPRRDRRRARQPEARHAARRHRARDGGARHPQVRRRGHRDAVRDRPARQAL
ncbi:MAG: hypothetical protein AVDCRST_MAG67-3793, partial [uncultured Solirubrobacteraceae bacterium]